MPLNSNIQVSVVTDLTATAGLSTADSPLRWTYSRPLASGTGLNQADKVWHLSNTLAASTSVDHDLAGSLTDALGVTFTLARVKGLFVAASASNTNNVIVGGAATNALVNLFGAATHTVTVRPGGLFAVVAPDAVGYAVTATTADLLRVANSAAGSSVTYEIVVIGASA